VLASLLGAFAGAWLVVLNAIVVFTTASVTTAVEAGVLGAAGAGCCLMGVRAARRAVRRRPKPEAPTPAPVDDDPLAWIRRRKFGARD
jgi:DNA-binding transcriptional LysR family regulator